MKFNFDTKVQTSYYPRINPERKTNMKLKFHQNISTRLTEFTTVLQNTAVVTEDLAQLGQSCLFTSVCADGDVDEFEVKCQPFIDAVADIDHVQYTVTTRQLGNISILSVHVICNDEEMDELNKLADLLGAHRGSGNISDTRNLMSPIELGNLYVEVDGADPILFTQFKAQQEIKIKAAKEAASVQMTLDIHNKAEELAKTMVEARVQEELASIREKNNARARSRRAMKKGVK